MTMLYGSIQESNNNNHHHHVVTATTTTSTTSGTTTSATETKTSFTKSEEKDPLLVHPNGVEQQQKQQKQKQQEQRSIWSRLTFSWFIDVLNRGNAKKKLDQEDLELSPLPEDCNTFNIKSTFDQYWEEELSKKNKTKTEGDDGADDNDPSAPSLVRALYRSFGKEYILRAGLLKLIHDLCLFVGPQVLHSIIVYLRDPNAQMIHGFYLTAAITVSQLVMSLCLRHYFFICYRTGLRIQTAIVVAVYRKALHLSAAERQARTLGEITNLMSIDAQRLQDLTTYLHSLWSSPMQIGLSMYFLWGQLGVSSLGGIAVIMIIIPTTRFVAKWMGTIQKTLMNAKDMRVELNTEVLSAMKVIKFQAWEEPFHIRIMKLRDIELKQLFYYIFGVSAARMLWVFTPLAVSISMFALYIWSGHQLNVAEALTALALFDILRFPLFMLPRVINNVVEASVSLDRVRSFLLCDEHKPIGRGSLEEIGIKMRDVSTAYDSNKPKFYGSPKDHKAKELADKDWEMSLLRSQLEDAERKIKELTNMSYVPPPPTTESSNLLCLRRINFVCKPGELIAIVGGVGCGKSSFINTILGDVRQIGGITEINGKLAYFSQSPFIMNASVRDNILFGHVDDEMIDEELYQRCLSCCALRHDLELLPDGEATEIGEKGVTLSGGQKARVALARAVYHRADITVIDDALAAVDAHVAKTLFEDAILGELMQSVNGRQRSVILVTNALQHLNHPSVNKIVVLREGQVVEVGSFNDLAAKPDSVFSNFLSVSNKAQGSETMAEGGDIPPETIVDDMEGKEEARHDATKSSETVQKTAPAKLMTEEVRETGRVDPKLYLVWARAAGGWIVPIAILFAFAVAESITVVSNWWITYWSEHGTEESQTKFLAIYALINVLSAIAGLMRTLMVAFFSLRASRKMFAGLLSAVLHAPMSFYDTTPVGRLINRFSKDMYTIDEQLTDSLVMYLGTLFAVFSTVVVIVAITPIFAICLVPLVTFYVVEQRFFTLTYRELKRLDSVNRSPIQALLGETVDGVPIIRAFSAEQTLFEKLMSMIDAQQHAYYLTCAALSWLAVRLELIGTLIITFTVLSAVMEHANSGADDTFAGLAGLAISYALTVTQSLNWSVRMGSDLEARMVSVERVAEYSALDSEGHRETDQDKSLPPNWPSEGAIDFRSAKLRYRPELPLVLKGLDLHIPPGSKVGVVGRTGAGKSTLMVSLLRIVELCEGDIKIDGQNTRTVGLAKLRRNVAVVPQDPVLFGGSVRFNLDPFSEFQDDDLYAVLESVGLHRSGIEASNHSVTACRVETLDDVVSEGGVNFSVGQRQLIVIARALLRRAKIVVMDEATAAVDAATDAAIQKVMRTEFAGATCITVAHRLNTIMDSDYILVMDDGRVAEFDTPSTLLQKGGLFRDLVKADRHE